MPIESLEGAVKSNLNLVSGDDGFGAAGLLLAYIAESYRGLPNASVIGDGVERRDCPVLYQSRYKVYKALSPPIGLGRRTDMERRTDRWNWDGCPAHFGQD